MNEIREFAAEARSLRDTFFAALEVPGDGSQDPELLDTYFAALQRRVDESDPAVVPALAAVVEALRLLALSGLGSRADQRPLLRQASERPSFASLGESDVNSVVQAINDEFLHVHELEWTQHDLRRTFRFWTMEEKRSYLDYCVGVTEVLTAEFGLACFAYGLVLSLVRSGARLLPHDDDVDILVALPSQEFPTFKAALDRIELPLVEAGYVVSRGEYTPSHRWVSRPNRGMVDVFAGIIEGDTIASFPGPRGVVRTDCVFPPLEADIEGVRCPIPNDPFSYVEAVYGPGWKTPRISFRHQGSEYQNFTDLMEGS